MEHNDMMNKMDPEKKVKWTQELTDLGVMEDQIDDKLIWVIKKAEHKLNKLRLVLDAKGVDETKAKEVIEQLIAKDFTKDLATIRAWHEKHETEHNHDHCCRHCHDCHHPDEHHE